MEWNGMQMIRLENIDKSYKSEELNLNILQNINLTIERNEFLAIMGTSGSGKSTLMNIIGLLDRPTDGTYLLNDERINYKNQDDLSFIRNKSIGFVFQQFQLLNRTTALENVELPLIYAGINRKERIERAKKALEKVGLGNRLNHYPNQLSGGQKQRVAIARAIVNNPLLILADEPTGALDTKTTKKIMDILRTFNDEGHTIVLVTHEEEVASYAQRIVKIKDGQIYEDRRLR